MSDLDARKQAEIDYPFAIDEEGREWLWNKPFHHGDDPRMTARLLIDFALAVQILDLRPGMSLCDFGCGTGWTTRFAVRHGLSAEGYDISPEMIAIARELTEREHLDATFEVADFETLDLGRRFDACLIYDALHHSARPDLVLTAAHRALRLGGKVLLVEPNWKHRFQGREATDAYGVTEMGLTPRQYKKLLRRAGFSDIKRFHNTRKRLYSNAARDILEHLAEPIVYRALGLFWTQMWIRATAT